ncbi:MAG: hypothetical protein DI600_00375 [Cutibacterium granulosum]|nr:MAG: hypothetical protein DI600_00375 [Cutibacterium granulosum]
MLARGDVVTGSQRGAGRISRPHVLCRDRHGTWLALPVFPRAMLPMPGLPAHGCPSGAPGSVRPSQVPLPRQTPFNPRRSREFGTATGNS